MSKSEQKVVQYVNEARASELALASTLRAHIAMTPRGEYRSGLERHLGETKDHERRLQARLRELGTSRTPWQAGLGLAQSVTGQALVLAKGPLDLARGFSPEEKMLKNAKDECATEALEIATYDALEALARAVGDEETAALAASIRGDEERMLDTLRGQIPALTDAVVRSELHGESSYDPATTGAAETLLRAQGRAGEAADEARQAAADAAGQARQAAADAAEQTRTAAGKSAEQMRAGADRAAEQARTGAARAAEQARAAVRRATDGDPTPSGTPPAAEQARAAGDVTKAQAAASGAAGSESDLPIEGYDSLNAGTVVARLSDLSPDDLAKVDAYERAHKARVGVLRVTESRLSRSP